MTDRATPMLIGHRGAPRDRPENTLPSFLRALELQADGIELDVHCTKDRVVVVHHDEIPRATPPSAQLAGKRIDALTFDELQGFSVRGLALISTLEEALAVIKGRADVFVELKGAAIEHEVIAVIRASIAPARCAVHSFDHAQVARARALAPEIRGGILFDRPISEPVVAMRAADALDVWPSREHVDVSLVQQVHDAGGRVIPWTVNKPEQAVTLASLGVDGLCTDFIPVLRAAL
jgi:glycerophosphoryl diester phosphodiesterase